MEIPPAPSTLGDVPAGFDEWFFKGSRKEPHHRFASAGEMADALTRVLLAGERVAANHPRSARLAPPNAAAMRAGWSATPRRLARLLASAFDRASAQGAISTARLRTTARGVSKTVAEALSRPSWSTSGVLGLALLVAAGGLLFLNRDPRSAPAVVTDVTSSAAALSPAPLPVTPTPAPPAPPSAAPPEPETPPAPVLEPEKTQRSRVTAARSTSSRTTKARRRSKRHRRFLNGWARATRVT